MLKKLTITLVIGLSMFEITLGQNPGADTVSWKKSTDGSITKNQLDSSRYIPGPICWVSDFVNFFAKEENISLNSLIDSFMKETNIEMAVVTIDSSMMGPIGFENYSLLMMNTWGIGTREKNNGILILIVPEWRRIRIENGYEIEKMLTNEETKSIIDEFFIPDFREQKYYQGTKAGILELIRKLKQNGL